MFDKKTTFMDQQLQISHEGVMRLEKTIRENEAFYEKYLPINTQLMIDETLTATLSKKTSILKNLYDFEKVKFTELEEKIQSTIALDRKER